MAWDRNRSHWSMQIERPVASGQTITHEGLLLAAIREAGEEVVQMAGAATGLSLIGFAILDNDARDTLAVVEDFVVPAAPGPYTVQLSSRTISGAAAPNSILRVERQDTGADLTEVASGPATGEFAPDVATGIVTFNSAQAGITMRFYYRRPLTVAESRARFRERHRNNEASQVFGQVSIASGEGVIYTDMFDTTVDWDGVAAGAILSAAGGLLSAGGTGTAVPRGRVVHVPNPTVPMLGIGFSF